jgi:hypothetical protein
MVFAPDASWSGSPAGSYVILPKNSKFLQRPLQVRSLSNARMIGFGLARLVHLAI